MSHEFGHFQAFSSPKQAGLALNRSVKLDLQPGRASQEKVIFPPSILSSILALRKGRSRGIRQVEFSLD